MSNKKKNQAKQPEVQAGAGDNNQASSDSTQPDTKPQVDTKSKSKSKAERGIKVLVKRNIWRDPSNGGKAIKVLAGKIIVITKEERKQFGNAVTQDLPDDDED